MKKYIIPIMMLLPLTMQAQNVQTEQTQLEEAQKQLEAAKKALEIAKAKAEAARLKAQSDSINQAAAKTTPSISNEPKSPSQGWSIPTAITKKEEPKKATTAKVNGAKLKEDPKYLEGAVKLNAAGRVEFELDIDANGKSAQQIYNIMYKYMSDLTQNENNIASRMALVNPTEHVIANTMDEWLVFSNSFLSLDRTEFKYQLVAKIADNRLHLSLSRILYNYELDRSTGFSEPAENVIVDKIALTKKKNDLAKIYGKFRRLTIDRKNQIFNDVTALVKG